MSFNLAQPVLITNASSNVDFNYGPYNNVAAANAAVIVGLREKGRTVGIITAGAVVEYWWESGIADEDLVVKAPSLIWANITGTPTTLSGYGITDGVPSSRELTINGTTYNLSENRSWTVSSGGSIYTKQITAYRTTNQPSGTTMDLSTDGTGVSGLIGPTTANATWNVTIDTIATVIGITGDVTGVVIGDTYSETTKLVFKKVSGISTLVAIVSSDAGFDSSMTTSLMNYSVGGDQNLNLQFQFPIFAGAGLIQINTISKLEIVEVTY
jgi:hypothetical protein